MSRNRHVHVMYRQEGKSDELLDGARAYRARKLADSRRSGVIKPLRGYVLTGHMLNKLR